MNKGADLHISGALAFEVPITPIAGSSGIADFTDREARARRRELSKNFWQGEAASR
jgi:enoyl-CoA hydratase